MAKSLADLKSVLFLVKRSVQSETEGGSNIQYLNVLTFDTTNLSDHIKLGPRAGERKMANEILSLFQNYPYNGGATNKSQ
jgi:hypothetical protein